MRVDDATLDTVRTRGWATVEGFIPADALVTARNALWLRLHRPGRVALRPHDRLQAAPRPWTGRIAWPDRAICPGWSAATAAITVRVRDLFGFPPPGSDYWTPETLDGVQARYPAMDMRPYRSAICST